MKEYEALRAELIRLHRETPNDMELGAKVRAFVWQMMQQRSDAIKAEQLPGQMTIDDVINQKKA